MIQSFRDLRHTSGSGRERPLAEYCGVGMGAQSKRQESERVNDRIKILRERHASGVESLFQPGEWWSDCERSPSPETPRVGGTGDLTA